MRPSEYFHYCPRCGRATDGPVGVVPFRCGGCGLVYYFNAAVSAAAFILDADDDRRALFIRRGHDPGWGRLALAGGFIDPGERAEDAIRREIREEVGVDLRDVTWLGSFPNDYAYGGVVYPVIDLYFVGRAARSEAAALDGVDDVVWLDPAAIDPAELAFPSMRLALELYLKVRG